MSTSVFRVHEKRFKHAKIESLVCRCESPQESSTSGILDLRNVSSWDDRLRSKISAESFGHRRSKADKAGNPVTAFRFVDVPGLIILPSFFSEEEQKAWCRSALTDYADSSQHPNTLSTHVANPCSTTCYRPPMRWATLGFSYDWTAKSYNRDLYSSFPSALKEAMLELRAITAASMAKENVADEVSVYEPQAAIVNFYPVGSSMMCHQDVSEENLQQPLISISLGCSAIFLMGGQSRDEAPSAFLLRSGDVAVFTGAARSAFHSVPRILDDCPSFLTDKEDSDDEVNVDCQDASCKGKRGKQGHASASNQEAKSPAQAFVKREDMTDEDCERYCKRCMRHLRININVRQVYSQSCPQLFV